MHINYRDSKLTRILQPHLSGNAAIAIVCCASPAKKCVEETRNTLKFGYNAKRIKLKPKVNEIVDDKVLISCLKKELQDIRLKYAQLKEKVRTNGLGSGKKEESEFPMLDAFIARMSNSAKTIDFADAVESLSGLSGNGGDSGPRRGSGTSAVSASNDAAPASGEDNGETPEEDEDDVEAFRRQILAKFMAEAMEESGDNLDMGDDNDDDDDEVEEDVRSTEMNRTYTEESMMTGFVTETDDDTPTSGDSEAERKVTAVFRNTPEARGETQASDAHALPLVSKEEPEPKRSFLGDAEEKMDEHDLNLIEKFRSEILEKFQDEIVDEEAAEELDENAQNVAVIANELITKFKKEIVYKFKDDFPEIQVKQVDVDLSAARVGNNGIVGRVIDGQVNTTDDSSGSGSSVEQFEDEFDEEVKVGESKPAHHELPKRAYSSLTDRAVVNGHGEGPEGKFLPRSDTGESSLPLRQSLGAGTSGSVSSDLSSDVADRDKGSSNVSPQPANPPSGEDDDDDYVIPPGEIAVGKGAAGGNVEGKVRIKFLEEKLAATDELVETLFVELENAKTFIRELVFENAGGGGIDHSGAALFGAAGTSGVTVVDEQILNQCEILKFGIYTSLLFFVFGQHELFLATVFFLWLSLEVATKA